MRSQDSIGWQTVPSQLARKTQLVKVTSSLSIMSSSLTWPVAYVPSYPSIWPARLAFAPPTSTDPPPRPEPDVCRCWFISRKALKLRIEVMRGFAQQFSKYICNFARRFVTNFGSKNPNHFFGGNSGIDTDGASLQGWRIRETVSKRRARCKCMQHSCQYDMGCLRNWVWQSARERENTRSKELVFKATKNNQMFTSTHDDGASYLLIVLCSWWNWLYLL